MGFLIKVLLIFSIIYMIFNFLGCAIFGTRRKPRNNPYSRYRNQPKSEPERQEERILDYQKRSFETAEAIDVDFEEIKENDTQK